MNDTVKKVITIVCTVVFLCCLAGLAYIFVGRYLENRVDEQVSGLVKSTPAPSALPLPTELPEPSSSPEPVVLEKYSDVVAQNPDTIGWLKIEGTAIDNVVMWTPEDPDKYLHLDFYCSYSNRGTLYLDEDCDVWNSDNLIIYGHHMQSSAMFGDLDLYAQESYWADHKTIQFDTIYQEQTYEVVAAFYARILYKNEEGFRYYQFIDAADEDAFNEYVRFIDENQCYDTGVDIAYGDQLLTLSTCAYHVENGRFVVVAKRIEPDVDLHADAGNPEGHGMKTADVTIDDPGTPLAPAPMRPLGTERVLDDVPMENAAGTVPSGFSTNLILLALCLLGTGTVLCLIYRRQQS